MSKKGIQSVCFRVRLKGQGIVNYGDTNQAAMRLELCHQHGVDYDDVKKSNQQFAKVNYYKRYNSDEEYQSEVNRIAEKQGKAPEEVKRFVPEYACNLKISSNCLRHHIFLEVDKADAPIWDSPKTGSTYIASPLGYVRGYFFPVKNIGSFNKKTSLTVSDAEDKNAVLQMELFTRSGDRDETSLFEKETTGNTDYVFECVFDVKEAQFLSMDDIYARNAVPTSYYEGENELEKRFRSRYGRIPYKTGVYTSCSDIFDTTHGGEFGAKMDDQFTNDLIKVVAKRLLSIVINKAGAYARTYSVEYKPIYCCRDDIVGDAYNDGWTEIKNENEIPDFEIYQFYVEGNHDEYENRIKAFKDKKKETKNKAE